MSGVLGSGGKVTEGIKVEENTVWAGAIMGGTYNILPAAQALGCKVQLAFLLPRTRTAEPQDHTVYKVRRHGKEDTQNLVQCTKKLEVT